MKLNIKPEKGWQKNGVLLLVMSYLLLGMIFYRKDDLVMLVESAAVAGEKSGADDSNYMEIKKIALTFDDGPHPIYTEQILDGLKERGVKATFFITGEHAVNYPEIVERIHNEGHTIGNHTYSHLQLTSRNEQAFAEELRETSKVIEEITGEATIFVRPPYGNWNKKFEKDLQMFPVLWTIDPLDWCHSDASCVVRTVLSKAKENGIILLHDEYESTKVAALEIVDRLTEEGYEFVTVDEILFN